FNSRFNCSANRMSFIGSCSSRAASATCLQSSETPGRMQGSWEGLRDSGDSALNRVGNGTKLHVFPDCGGEPPSISIRGFLGVAVLLNHRVQLACQKIRSRILYEL